MIKRLLANDDYKASMRSLADAYPEVLSLSLCLSLSLSLLSSSVSFFCRLSLCAFLCVCLFFLSPDVAVSLRRFRLLSSVSFFLSLSLSLSLCLSLSLLLSFCLLLHIPPLTVALCSCVAACVSCSPWFLSLCVSSCSRFRLLLTSCCASVSLSLDFSLGVPLPLCCCLSLSFLCLRSLSLSLSPSLSLSLSPCFPCLFVSATA